MKCREEVYSDKGPGQGYALQVGDQVACIYSDEVVGFVSEVKGNVLLVDQQGCVIKMSIRKVYFRPTNQEFDLRRSQTTTGAESIGNGFEYDFDYCDKKQDCQIE